jgi:hypothetical protein
MIKSEDNKGDAIKSAKPMPFKLTKLVPAAEADSETSVHALFDPIISEIRDYLQNLA